MAALLIVICYGSGALAEVASRYGGFGPEGPRMREQLWILPSGDPQIDIRATLFRPPATAEGHHRHPLVVINHGTSDRTRLAQAQPVFYWLSRWFVERSFVVVLPERRGHGATGGPLAESVGTCAQADHYRSGLVAADDVQAAVQFMQRQDFVDPDDVVVVGISTGGWASLALASRNPPGVRAVVDFAGGRGGHAYETPGRVCARERLIAAAAAYGATARVPTLWLYSRNDSYFNPDVASAMVTAWSGAGGDAEFHLLPPYGTDGHALADDEAGWDLWGAPLERFLSAHHAPRDAPVPASVGEISTVSDAAAFK